MILDVMTLCVSALQTRDRRSTALYCSMSATAVLICAAHGLSMDVDSTGYLAAALNLAHGRGLTGIGNTTFTLFAPALSSLIAVGVRFGLSAQTTDLVLNITSAIFTVILGRTLLMRHLSDRRLINGGSVFVALGWPLLQVNSLALSEPLTVVTVLLLILVLEDFNATSRPIASLLSIGVLLNLIFFIHYAGLAFVPVATFIVLIERRGRDSLTRRILSASVLALLACIGPVLWMLRNKSVNGTLLGPRYPSVVGVSTVAHQYVQTIAKLFLPGPAILEVVVFIAVVVASGVALQMVYRAQVGGFREFVRRLAPWAVIIYFCSAYALYLYVAELSTKIDPIDSRLLIPIYVPCVVLSVGLVESVLKGGTLGNKWKLYVRRILLLFVGAQILMTCALVADFAANGRDFNSTAWRNSPLLQVAKSIPGTTTVYTNNVPGLWARLGNNNILQLPASIEAARGILACPGARVVYFSHLDDSYFGSSSNVAAETSAPSPSALKSRLSLREIFASDQGEVLLVPGKSTGTIPSSACQ